MAEAINPRNNPDHAATQLVLALIEAKAIGCGKEYSINSEGGSKAVSDAIIDIHKRVAEYYRELNAGR